VLAEVQSLNRLTGRIVIGHFDEAEALAAACIAILNHLRATHLAEFREYFLELRAVNAVAQIAYIKFLTHERLLQTVLTQDKADPLQTSWVETKGTNMVVRQVGPAREKVQADLKVEVRATIAVV
jgi:hypothetical protein